MLAKQDCRCSLTIFLQGSGSTLTGVSDMSAQLEFNKVVNYLSSSHDGEAGQMFGKKCIKVNKKAAVALFKEYIVFKLPGSIHTEAVSLTGSELWDPSGKNRPMKEWVQVTVSHKSKYKKYAKAAADYVGH